MNWGGTHEENTAHDNNFRSRQLPDSGLDRDADADERPFPGKESHLF